MLQKTGITYAVTHAVAHAIAHAVVTSMLFTDARVEVFRFLAAFRGE